MFSQSPDTAGRFFNAIEDTCRQLAESPELGEKVATQSEATAGMRFWRIAGFTNHLLFCRRVANGVEIVRVLHAARDWRTIIESRSEHL